MDVVKAHQYCTNNREAIEKSKIYGCFYCLKIFNAKEVDDWIDKDEDGVGKTALCPYCHIDSLIGDFNISVDEPFLKKLKSYWF